MRLSFCAAALGGLVLALPLAAANAASTRFGSGANAAAIQTVIDNFRAELGTNNGVGGTFSSGRREINWDGVPDEFAAPNFLAPDFFNVNSPRGVVFAALEYDTGSALNDFLVSADSSNPTTTATEFANINASYAAIFQPFSAQRLFHIRNAHAMDVMFFVPGTTIPATTRAFGAIFSDVDGNSGGDRSVIRCYGTNGAQELAASVPAFNNGLSFLAIVADPGDPGFARCNIEIGNSDLGSGNTDGSGGVDVVALDDFIYAEPVSIFTIFADGF